MKYLSILIITFAFQSVYAETTGAETVSPVQGLDDGSTAGETTCTLRVRRSTYSIRRRPNARGRERSRGRCGGTLDSSDISRVSPIGLQGNWVKISHPNCPNREAYVWHRAFNSADMSAYREGRCGAGIFPSRGSREQDPPPAAAPGGAETGSYGHRFVLDRCYGLRNDSAGQGHYLARRRGRPTHGGCDYAAPLGTVLRSPCNGRVTDSRNVGRGGIKVEIRCNNGHRFKLMHVQTSPRARAGTRVSAGTEVARVGKTGNANSRSIDPHVHLEAFIGGRRVDPQSIWSCGIEDRLDGRRPRRRR